MPVCIWQNEALYRYLVGRSESKPRHLWLGMDIVLILGEYSCTNNGRRKLNENSKFIQQLLISEGKNGELYCYLVGRSETRPRHLWFGMKTDLILVEYSCTNNGRKTKMVRGDTNQGVEPYCC